MADQEISGSGGIGIQIQYKEVMDNLSPERRSGNMRKITAKNTFPELAVRKLCRELGFSGYRIHRKDLPGRPDIAWLGRKKAIFVHGCFWHGHDCREGLRKPKSNQAYWIPKIERNKQRDSGNIRNLRDAGWDVLIIWECQILQRDVLLQKVSSFLQTNTVNNK